MPFELHISPFQVEPPPPENRFPFSYLFLSFCHSKGLPENELLFKALNMKFSKNQEYSFIDLIHMKYDFRYQPAILSTIRYGFNIHTLLLSGETVVDSANIFEILSKTIRNNSQCLSSLTILNCSVFTGFSEFCNSILLSYVHNLCFDGVQFKTKILEEFINILPESTIEKLHFIRCPLKPSILELLNSKASNFSKLRLIAMNDTDFLKTTENFTGFFQFLNRAKISNIELVNDRIDIADIFWALSQSDIPITSLNVSKNFCSSKFSGHYTLPVTIEDIKLAGVIWSPTALFNLLTVQSYVNLVQLDISNQLEREKNQSDESNDSVHEETLLRMHRALKPKGNMNIKSLIWNCNILSTGFFSYLSNLKNLKKLAIDCCICDRNEAISIQNDLVFYLQNSNLEAFSVRGSDPPDKNLVKGLFAVIGAHQTLRAIDVSNNEIGDEGLEMIVDCVSKNKNIERIAFDGSKLQKPQKFINCCERMMEIDNLKFVAEPRKDMNELKKQEELLKLTPGMVENAWDRLEAKLLEAERNQNLENISLFNSEPYSSTAVFSTIPVKEVAQRASWDITISVPYDKEPNTWEELRDQFSLQALTGIKPDDKDALIVL